MRQNKHGPWASPFCSRVHDAPKEKPFLHAGPSNYPPQPPRHFNLHAPHSPEERRPLVTTPEHRLGSGSSGTGNAGYLVTGTRSIADFAEPGRAAKVLRTRLRRAPADAVEALRAVIVR